MAATVTTRSSGTTDVTADVRSREIPTRRMEFRYPEIADLPQHPMGDSDLIHSHIFAALSAVFPDGEDFFVRSVRRYRDQIADPELAKQVAGFIGQEAMHGRAHRQLNDRLAEMGYPTTGLAQVADRLLKTVETVMGPTFALAVTAALEHYTATLAADLLSNEQAQQGFSVDEFRYLLMWHALEESEHKAVAFDVYQQVSGNTAVRLAAMDLTTIGFLGVITGGVVVSVLRDPVSRNPVRLLRSLRSLRSSSFARPDLLRKVWDYHRRDFHPDDHDTTALEVEWRERFFGDDGELNDRVKGARSVRSVG